MKKLFIFLLIISFSFPFVSFGATLGKTTIGANWGNQNGGYNICSPASTTSTAGMVTQFNVYVTSTVDTSYKWVGSIYSASSSAPYSLLAQTASTTFTAGGGWKTSSMSYTLTTNTDYWLCYVLNDNITQGEKGAYDAGATMHYDYLGAGSIILHDPFVETGTEVNRLFSFYVNYTTSTPSGGGRQLRGQGISR